MFFFCQERTTDTEGYAGQSAFFKSFITQFICYCTVRDNCGRLLEREVVQVVTPGTLIEPLNNDANYLMAIAKGPGLASLGLAWIDLSTAQFEVYCEALLGITQYLLLLLFIPCTGGFIS